MVGPASGHGDQWPEAGVTGDDADTTRKALVKEMGRRALAGDLKCWLAQHLAMVTNGLSQVVGDDADTTRKALTKEVGRRDLTDPREWSAQPLAMVTNVPESGDGGRRRHDPEGAGQRSGEACPCRRP